MYKISGIELWRWRQQAQQQARLAQIPPGEVDWLLQEVAGLDRLSLKLETFKDAVEIGLRHSLSDLDQLWQQRLQHVPVQYLAGTTSWRQFSLLVSPAVLIPRPETELLIDLVLAAEVQLDQPSHWADLGSGSGAIALGLAEALPLAKIHAVEVSPAALEVAQQNAQRTGFASRIRFYRGSWFEPLAALRGQLDGMVSNPPYIPQAMLADLQPEVQQEPQLALDGGLDGLDCIRRLIVTAPAYLKSGGLWLVELMAGQARPVAELLAQQGDYRDIQIHADLTGIERFVLAYRR
ncbi:MAG: peptide chain release factor N(5)-glutamine methyltransferase [Elainella sp.]